MVHVQARECIDCKKPLKGHGNPIRCHRCAALKRYTDKFGKPPERIIAKCEVCEKEFSDYATNRKKQKHGVLFCSQECRAIWVGVHNSISRGGSGVAKSKSEKDKLYYRRKADHVRKGAKQYYLSNRDAILDKKRKDARARKQTVIDYYGGKCNCCGESLIEFLTIDHINNDGAEHRKRMGKGTKIYMDIIRNNFPSGQYRVLCFNCNITRGFYGYCPHHPEDKYELRHKPYNPGRRRTVK